jgi:septal ring factor EnvC (AmiA/AmiB activator)
VINGPGASELEDVMSRLEASEDIRMEVCSRLAEAESRLAEVDAQLSQASSRAEVHELRSQALESELRQAQTSLADFESISAGRVAMLNQQVCIGNSIGWDHIIGIIGCFHSDCFIVNISPQ